MDPFRGNKLKSRGKLLKIGGDRTNCLQVCTQCSPSFLTTHHFDVIPQKGQNHICKIFSFSYWTIQHFNTQSTSLFPGHLSVHKYWYIKKMKQLLVAPKGLVFLPFKTRNDLYANRGKMKETQQLGTSWKVWYCNPYFLHPVSMLSFPFFFH